MTAEPGSTLTETSLGLYPGTVNWIRCIPGGRTRSNRPNAPPLAPVSPSVKSASSTHLATSSELGPRSRKTHRDDTPTKSQGIVGPSPRCRLPRIGSRTRSCRAFFEIRASRPVARLGRTQADLGRNIRILGLFMPLNRVRLAADPAVRIRNQIRH